MKNSFEIFKTSLCLNNFWSDQKKIFFESHYLVLWMHAWRNFHCCLKDFKNETIVQVALYEHEFEFEVHLEYVNQMAHKHAPNGFRG